MKIIFATGNMDKLREIREIFEGSGFEIISMKEAGITADIVEDGKTFAENSVIKARAVWEAYKENICENTACPTTDCDRNRVVVMADDSGLEIDALGGAPGVLSARFMGEHTDYHIKCAELIRQLEGVPDERRSARFRDVISAVLPDGEVLTADAAMEGRIGYEYVGEHGFGYDPIFFLPEYGMTSAQISPEEKNAISHRGKALRAMKKMLEEKGFSSEAPVLPEDGGSSEGDADRLQVIG